MNSGSQARRLQSRGARVAVLAATVVIATSGAAHALTGSLALSKSVNFYYGETAGSGDSQDFDGYGTAKMCARSEGYSSQTYVAQYLRNRTLQPDDKLKDVLLAYNAYVAPNSYGSATFSTASSSRYHTTAIWPAVPSAPNNAVGAVTARTTSC